jgi:aspartyl aminopeptidase
LEKEVERNAWIKIPEREKKDIEILGADYLAFLNQAKTERETVNYLERLATAGKFSSWEEVKKLKPGQKIFISQKNKVFIAIVIGERPLSEGFNIIAAHGDTPRLDLKPVPLYEDCGLALFKTHYYGGIKKYQWTALPLALHGVVIKKSGKTVTVTLGEEESDPVFTITDLLPHLAKDQMEKKLSEGVTGEALNILVGSTPASESKEKERIKESIQKILQTKYDIEQDDFASAELQLVPALKAREVGFDRSLIGSYGQDDRVSAFTAFKALTEIKKPPRTAVVVVADKEEIGSVGNTGLRSYFLENTLADLMSKAGNFEYYHLRSAMRFSYALSADVNGALDPNYEGVFDKLNSSVVGQGVSINKYTGSRGKYDASDANPEFVARIRKLFDDNQVPWQLGELGKVDQGGGGTVAQFLARYGMDVLDCGVALMGMHSPFEIASKADIYAAYKAYRVFMESFQ